MSRQRKEFTVQEKREVSIVVCDACGSEQQAYDMSRGEYAPPDAPMWFSVSFGNAREREYKDACTVNCLKDIAVRIEELVAEMVPA